MAQVLGSGRKMLVGTVLAAAALGLGATVIVAATRGSEGPRVEPIMVNGSDRPEADASVDLTGDGADDESNRDGRNSTPGRPRPVAGAASIPHQSTPDGSGQPSGAPPEANVSGPVPTAPPPAPIIATPVDSDDADGTGPSDDTDDPDDGHGDDPGHDDSGDDD